jgi:hypothetical protein
LLRKIRELEERKEEYEEMAKKYVGCGEDEYCYDYYYCEEEDEYCYRESAWDGEEMYIMPINGTALLIDIETRYGDTIVSVSAIDDSTAFDVLTIKKEQGKLLIEIASKVVEPDTSVVFDG